MKEPTPPSSTALALPSTKRMFAAAATAIGLIMLAVATLFAAGYIARAAAINNDVSVELDDTGIHAAVITISVGTKVVWENTSDTLMHTLAFSDGVASDAIRPSHKYDRTFNSAGTRTYTDAALPGKTGTINVVAGVPEPGEKEKAEMHISTSHNQSLSAGATVDYHVRYENNSDGAAAQNVLITVSLPTSAALVSSSPTPLSQVANTLVYSIGTLPARAERQIDLKIKLPSPLPDGSEVKVKAVISASNIGANSGDTSEDHQANPQFSDSLYPDKVLIAGYYSFFVPPGAYRIQVVAPGFLAYESNTVVVQAAQVTLNVPLERTSGTLTTVSTPSTPSTPSTQRKVFLPVIIR